MPRCCAVEECSSNGYNAPSRSFHRFPFSKPEILRKWIANIGQPGWYPTANSVLCSNHFTPDMFVVKNGQTGHCVWLTDAVPIDHSIAVDTAMDCDRLNPAATSSTSCITNDGGGNDDNVSAAEQAKKAVPSCCVPGCGTTRLNSPDISFHSLPLSNPVLLDKWLRNMQMPDWRPEGKPVVCSNHFAPEMIDQTRQTLPRRVRLKSDAVPTLFRGKSKPDQSPLPECGVEPVQTCSQSNLLTMSTVIYTDLNTNRASVLRVPIPSRAPPIQQLAGHPDTAPLANGTTTQAAVALQSSNVDHSYSTNSNVTSPVEVCSAPSDRVPNVTSGDEQDNVMNGAPPAEARNTIADHSYSVHVNSTDRTVVRRPVLSDVEVTYASARDDPVNPMGCPPVAPLADARNVDRSYHASSNATRESSVCPSNVPSTSNNDVRHFTEENLPAAATTAEPNSTVGSAIRAVTPAAESSAPLEISARQAVVRSRGKGSCVSTSVGDHQYVVRESPSALKAKLEQSREKIVAYRKKQKGLQQKVRRLQARVNLLNKTLKSVLKNNPNALADLLSEDDDDEGADISEDGGDDCTYWTELNCCQPRKDKTRIHTQFPGSISAPATGHHVVTGLRV